MKYIFKVLIFLVISSPLFAQKDKSAILTFSNSVAFLNDSQIENIWIDGKKQEIWLKDVNDKTLRPKIVRKYGSAFFVRDTAFSFYLVTAEHVARGMSFNSDLVCSGDNYLPIVFKLKDIAFCKDSLNWIYNKTADVAVLLLDNNSKLFGNSSAYFIPIEIVESERIPVRERDVTIIGFPMDLGYNQYFSPISKISKPSSGLIEYPRFDNQIISTFYFLDDPGISGFSGAPVYELPAEIVIGERQTFVSAYRLMGLVHGSLGDKTGGGFAAIVPSKYIIETLNYSPKFSGTLNWYHENGNLWSQRIINEGRVWTVINNFDSNGKEVEKGSLINGSGSLFIYSEDGVLELIEHYKAGGLVSIEDN